MAKTQADQRSKAAIIREYLVSHAHLGPTAMAQAIEADHPGRKVSAAEISAAKTKIRDKEAKANGKPQSPAKVKSLTKTPSHAQMAGAYMPGNGLASQIVTLKGLITSLGGKDEIKRLIDVL